MKNKIEHLDISHYFLFMLIFAFCFLCYKMMDIYLHSIFFAIILSTITHPVYKRIEKKLKGRKALSATISCFLLTVIIIIPLSLIFIAVVKQGIVTAVAITEWASTADFSKLHNLPYVSEIIAFANKHLPENFLANFDIYSTIKNISTSTGKLVITEGGNIIGNLSAIVMNFFLMIFVYFFVVQKQKEMFAYIFHLMPLSTEYENILIQKISAVSKSALLGTLVTALAQGFAGGIAFTICGLPGFFWGAVMAFASLIPMVGTALIWLPAAIYLIAMGKIKLSIFLIIWSVVVVGTLDNLVRPLFMKGSADMSTILIFFAILGGLNLFGLMGLLYGPLIFGLTLVLFYIYSLEFGSFLDSQDKIV